MTRPKPESGEIVPIATNRRARHEYEVFETFEAGLVLVGTEVKALRAGQCSIAEGYVTVHDGAAWLRNAEINEYSYGNRLNHQPKQVRKLLLHARELKKLEGKARDKGLTIVPLRLYFKKGWAKVEIAIVKGKKLWDKRATKADQDAKRMIARVQRRGGRDDE
ncbi:MAG: SsrA-binding protein SmpB [Planctomycetes bacterium]|nr:SsrA-binding protein SmpB [Planctomycetota bacterium]MCC7169833.1 SsrA-binding protein SmpB [Planctomycetota bacterium]